MADNQQQLDPNDPWAVKARQLGTAQAPTPAQAPSSQLDPNDPWVVKAKQLQQPAQTDPNDPWAVKARQLGITPQQQPSDQDEGERLGEGQSWLTKPLQTSLFGLGEYRKGATGIERGAEKFASGLLSPLSLGLMLVTGGLGSIAEAGAATAGEEAATGFGANVLSKLAPETAAKVATASGTISKLANFGFTSQQIIALADKAPQFSDAIKAGDTDKALELGTSLLLEGAAAHLSTSHLMKSINGSDEPVWSQDKDVIAASQQPVREAGANALAFRKANEPLIRNTPATRADRRRRLYKTTAMDARSCMRTMKTNDLHAFTWVRIKLARRVSTTLRFLA